jgi:hypothetical protein
VPPETRAAPPRILDERQIPDDRREPQVRRDRQSRCVSDAWGVDRPRPRTVLAHPACAAGSRRLEHPSACDQRLAYRAGSPRLEWMSGAQSRSQQLLGAPCRQAVDRSVASPHDEEQVQEAPAAVLQALFPPVQLQQEQLALPRFPSPAPQASKHWLHPQRELPLPKPLAFQAQQAPPLPTQVLPP